MPVTLTTIILPFRFQSRSSRARHWSIYNQLGYRIMDYSINFPIMQSGDYSWTLEDVDAFVYDTED